MKQSGAPKLRAIPDALAKGEPIAVGLDELGDWQKPTELRWISLRSLDDQLHSQVELGARSPIAAELLGGLCRIDYLAWDPAANALTSRSTSDDFAVAMPSTSCPIRPS